MLNGHWPADYHAAEHSPEDQSWGWLIVVAVAALAGAGGALIGWPAAVAVIVVTMVLILARVWHRRRSEL